MRSEDGFEFFWIRPIPNFSVLQHEILDSDTSSGVRRQAFDISGNWSHLIRSRGGVRCNIIQSSGAYKMMHFNGTSFVVAAEFTANNIPAQHTNPTNSDLIWGQ